MKRKQLVSLAMSLLLAGTMLAGCGSSQETESAVTQESAAQTEAAETEKTEAPKAETASDGNKVHITYAQWGNDTETAATQAVADKFNSEQDEIFLNLVWNA